MEKIYILGLAGAGKTYLAKKLSNRYKVERYPTDWILYRKNGHNKRIRVKEEDYRKRIREISNTKKWIIEGVHYFEYTAKRADIIIFLDTPLNLIIMRLIKRYLFSGSYRQHYGIRMTTNLIFRTIWYYYHTPNKTLWESPKYKSRTKYKTFLKKYESKTLILKDNNIDALEDLNPTNILISSRK